MMIKAVCAALFVATASSAVLPKLATRTDYPPPIDTYFWNSTKDTTEDVIRAADNAWARLDLKFPIRIFDKSSNTIWVSMNGVVSLDEPITNVPNVPERPLPVDPKVFTNDGPVGSYFPRNAIAPFWRDMSIKAETEGTYVRAEYRQHSGLESPRYHIYFRLCDKAEKDWAPAREVCGKATRNFILTFTQDQPGVYSVLYLLGGEKDIQATVGVQAYPEYMSIPVSTFWGETSPCSMVSVDTNTQNVTVQNFGFCI
ncbi:hypothetical protein ABW21_db0209282 [Orbilia brochopaga]|nr:hypothetical protein ABW21_db0209282 [Drechslerella brochopaga]